MKLFNLRSFNMKRTAMPPVSRLENRPLHEFVIQKIGEPLSMEAQESLDMDRTFAQIAGQAVTQLDRSIDKCESSYEIDEAIAKKLTHTWVGYHKDYGGMTIYVMPYMSSGFWHGKAHIQEGAVDKFYCGYRKTTPTTAKAVESAGKKRIREWLPRYGIEFTLDDMKLSIYSEKKLTPEQMEAERLRREERARITGKPTRSSIPKERIANLTTLNPENAQFREYFAQNNLEMVEDEESGKVIISKNGITPEAGVQTYIKLNTSGFDKLLKKYAPEWYEKAIAHYCFKFNTTPEELLALAAENESSIEETSEEIKPEVPAVTQAETDAEIRTAARTPSINLDVGREKFTIEILYGKTRQLVQEASKGEIAKLAITPEDKAEALAEQERAQKVTMPMGYTQKEYGDELGTQNVTNIKELVYSAPGTMPSYKDKSYTSVFGAATSTGVEASMEETKTKNAILENEVMKLIHKDINITSDEIVKILLEMNPKRKKRILSGKDSEQKLAFFKEKVDEIMKSMSENKGKITEVSQDSEDMSVQGYHASLQSALTEMKVKWSQNVMHRDVSGALYGNVSDKMAEAFSLPYDVTSEQLKQLRERAAKKKLGQEVPDASTILTGLSEQEAQKLEAEPVNEGLVDTEVIGPQGRTLNVPPAEGQIGEGQQVERTPEQEVEEFRRRRPFEALYNPNRPRGAEDKTRKIIIATLKSLIKIAAEMDDEGKNDAAEEIHKVIRKYQQRI